MNYCGQAGDLNGTKEIFGQKIVWIRLLNTGSLPEVPKEKPEDLVIAHPLIHICLIASAARIKHEVAEKNIIALYESSLNPSSSPNSCPRKDDTSVF